MVVMLHSIYRQKKASNAIFRGPNSGYLRNEDIKSCFPQMNMSPESAVLIAMRITATIILFVLLDHLGGLAHLWLGASIIGSAILRICDHKYKDSIDLYLIFDDFVGFGLLSDTVSASAFICSLILDVCGPDSVSLDKSVHSQQADVIGWYVYLLDPVLGASIHPKTDAIHKMCYYFFSFDIDAPQPLVLWQILQS